MPSPSSISIPPGPVLDAPLDGVVGYAVALWWRNLWRFALLAVALFVPLHAVASLLSEVDGTSLLLFGRPILGVLLGGVIAHVIFHQERHSNLVMRDSLVAVVKRAPALLVVGLLSWLAMMIGMVFCIVPGLAALVVYSLAGSVVMIESASPVFAMTRSQRLLANQKWAGFTAIVGVWFLYTGLRYVVATQTGIYHLFHVLVLTEAVHAAPLAQPWVWLLSTVDVIIGTLPAVLAATMYVRLRRCEQGGADLAPATVVVRQR